MSASIKEGQPVRVSLIDIEGGAKDVMAPKKKAYECVIITNSYPLAVGALPVQILAHSPKRKIAQILINGSTTDLVAFGTSESDCQDATSAAANEFIGAVAYVTGPFPSTIPITGTTELWAVLIVAGSGPTIISAIKEIEN